MKIPGKVFACLTGILAHLTFSGATSAAPAPPPLEVYGSLPQTEAVELSADGSMLAMVSSLNGQRALIIKRVDGQIIVKAGIGDQKFTGLSWAGNDFVVVYLNQTARLALSSAAEQEFSQGVIVTVKDGSTKPLLRQSPDYLSAVFGHYGFFEQDGRWVGYFGVIPTAATGDPTNSVGDFKQRYPDLYKVDFETGRVQRVTSGTPKSRSWVLDSTAHIAAESDYDSNSGNWRVFLPGSPSRPLVSGNAPYGFKLMGLSRTPGTILLSQGGSDSNLWEVHLDTGRMETFLPADKPLTLIPSPATRLLLGAVLLDENGSIIFDPALDHHYQSLSKAFQGHLMRLVSVSADLNRMLVYVSGKDTAGTWQFVDFKAGKAEPVAEEYPAIPDEMIGGVQMFDYSATDGLALHGVLTLPPMEAARNLPLIVMPHDGPETHDRVQFNWWAQALAVRGYAVFQPNFRGSGGYGFAFRNAGFGQWGRKMETDISDGVAALAAKSIIDPKRVCIIGAFYGGYAALAGVTLQHGIYRCAASYAGISDPRDLIYSKKAFDKGDTQRYADTDTRYLLSYLGFQSPDDQGLAAISPREQAAKADAPILLIYAQRATGVPPQQTTDMALNLRNAGKPVEVMEISGENQSLLRPDTRLQMLKAMVAFVEKYNPPDAPH